MNATPDWVTTATVLGATGLYLLLLFVGDWLLLRYGMDRHQPFDHHQVHHHG